MLLACLAVQVPASRAASGDGAQEAASSMKSVGLRALLAQSSLTDQDNRPLAVGRRREDIVVLNFIFTGCAAICPMQTADLVAVAKALPADALSHVQFVSVTVDPLHDTPQMLKAYARAHGADLRHWSF